MMIYRFDKSNGTRGVSQKIAPNLLALNMIVITNFHIQFYSPYRPHCTVRDFLCLRYWFPIDFSVIRNYIYAQLCSSFFSCPWLVVPNMTFPYLKLMRNCQIIQM